MENENNLFSIDISDLFSVDISKKTNHEIEWSTYTLGFEVETLGDSNEVCRIPLQINTEALYSGRSGVDCILDLISYVKSFIPDNVVTIKKDYEKYKDSDNPSFQSLYLMIKEPHTNTLGLLIPNIYIKSYADWQAILVNVLRDKAMKTIEIK